LRHIDPELPVDSFWARMQWGIFLIIDIVNIKNQENLHVFLNLVDYYDSFADN
jgi:hypothetical protein